MDTGDVIVRIEGGVFVGLESTNRTIHRVTVVTDGVAERQAAVRQLSTEHQIAEAVRLIRDGELNSAWHLLDSAGGIARVALGAAVSACSSLADQLSSFEDPRGVHGDLEARLADAIRLHAQRIETRRALVRAIEGLDGLDDAEAAAAAAHGGGHQQPPVVPHHRTAA